MYFFYKLDIKSLRVHYLAFYFFKLITLLLLLIT